MNKLLLSTLIVIFMFLGFIVYKKYFTASIIEETIPIGFKKIDDEKLKPTFIELIPNVGLKEIRFGMNRNEVREKIKMIFGQEKYVKRSDETECYFSNSLQFSYEKDDTLSFIESASAPPVYVTILGINTWEISGVELLRLLKEKDSVNISISGGGSYPIFEKTHIALWELDEQYDHIGQQSVPKWGSIGIGDDRYYKAICKMHEK